jgi:hypothetical protein
MSSKDKDFVISITFGGPRKYVKGVAGSFDESYFKDPQSGQFTFPDYNTRWKGMVRFKDTTKYKKDFAERLSKKQIANLNLDNFEYHFIPPEFQVESFPNFIRRFPEACFNKGISKARVLSLFEQFVDWMTYAENAEKYGESHNPVDEYYYMYHKETREALALGLLETVVQPNAIKYWSNQYTSPELNELCDKHDITPGKNKAVTIEMLIAKKIPFKHAVVAPTELLKQTYWSFIDLYVNDIRNNADQFHPLYLAPLWRHLQRHCDERGARRRIEKIVANPYWNNRLYTFTRQDNSDDDE